MQSDTIPFGSKCGATVGGSWFLLSLCVAVFLAGVLIGTSLTRAFPVAPVRVDLGVQAGGDRETALSVATVKAALRVRINVHLKESALSFGKDRGIGASKEALVDVILYTGMVTERNMGECVDRATLRLRGGSGRP